MDTTQLLNNLWQTLRASWRSVPGSLLRVGAFATVISALGVALAYCGDIRNRHRVDPTDERLVFEGTPVQEIVRQFNRRNRVQLQVIDPNLATRQVSAVFDASDSEAFVTFLESVADICVMHPSRNVIVIRSRAHPAVSSDRNH
jgi:ferric-dicitrate binding protein FerR (iron transport regulator)